MMSIDQVHPLSTNITPTCVDHELCIFAYVPSSRTHQELRDLQNRVIGEVANSVLCAQFGQFSRDTRRNCSDSGFWCVSSEDAADFDGDRVEIGAFGKFNLGVVKPKHGEVKIEVGDVVNIFQSIWAKLRKPTISQGFICRLPPFDGHLDYANSPDIESCGISSWHSNSTDARLKWYVQEKQGDGFLKLSLKRSEFCGHKNDDYFSGDNVPITTIDDGKFKPTQCEEFGYNPPEAAQSSFGHREYLPVDGRQANYSLSNVGRSSEEFPPPYSPTIDLDIEPGILRGYGSRTGLSPNTAHDGITADPALPLPETPFRNTHLDVPERGEGRYSGSNRAGRSAEEACGYGDQPTVHMPPGPYSMLGPESDHPDQHFVHDHGGRNPSVFEDSENHLHQSLEDQYFQGQEMTLDDPLAYQAATTCLSYQADNSASLDSLLEIDDQLGDRTTDGSKVLPLRDRFGTYQQGNFTSYLSPNVYTGPPDLLNHQDHSTGGLRFAMSRNGSTLSRLRGMTSRISSRLREL